MSAGVPNGLRVFLVEDSSMIRERVIEAVSEQGYADVIGCAETEDDALTGISRLKPDAVVLDIQLRQGNGLNVLRRLKGLPADSQPIVIVFTNHANPEFRRHAASQGALYFLDKISEFDHLEGLLRMLSADAAGSGH
jgi:two-component system, OmpR family, response regulator